MFSDDEAEPAGQTVDLDLDGAARRRTAAGLEVEPTPPVLVRVLGAVLFFLGRAYTFLRYTVFLYSLPPFVPESKLVDYRRTHGRFMSHRMTAAFFDWVQGNEGVVAVMIPLQGLHIFTNRVELIQQVLTDKRTYPTRGWTGFNTWVPDGLLGLPTGDRWALHRRLISRFLSTNYLQGYAQEMARAGATLLAKWKGTAGQETDVQHDLGICTLEIILSVAFGIKDDTVAKGDSQEYGWNQVADHILKETALSSQEPAFFRHLNPARGARFDKAIGWARAQVMDNMKDNETRDDQNNILSQLLRVFREERLLTEEEVIQEILTIAGAGHETTANTMSWALLLLAENQDVQQTLFDEVSAHTEGDVATFQEAKTMEFCLSVLYETLRLYPTVPLFPRESVVDTKLGGYDVPAGAKVVITQMAINKNPAVFKDPNRFDPDRFKGKGEPKTSLPVGGPGKGSAFDFLPFGAGARTCIGQRLAVLEIVILLSGVVKAFRVRLPPGHSPIREHASVTLRPRGLRLILEARPSG